MKGNITIFLNKKQATEKKRWFLLDAEGKILGRLASEIAKILMGKHRVDFTPNVDVGDGVIIINASKVKVSGAKEEQKVYHSYSGYVGGRKKVTYEQMKKKDPGYIIWHAIHGMMPKNKLARQKIKKNLRIFKGSEHNMEAQKPIKVGE